MILTQELQSVDEAHNLLWKSLALTFDGSFLPSGLFFSNPALVIVTYSIMFGGEKLLSGELNDVLLVVLATQFAKGSVQNFLANTLREKHDKLFSCS